MVIIGTLYKMLEYKEFEKFNVQSFVIKSDKNYFKIEAFHSLIDRIKEIEIGTETSVDIIVTGRLWKNKEGNEIFFNSLRAENIQRVNSVNQTSLPVDDEDDDLPF